MTENNAAQPPLTDDQIEALAKKHIAPHADRLDAIMANPVPYQQTEQFRRVKALIVDVLSNLRVPVADERTGAAEHYDEVKATLQGAHRIMEGISAIERRVGPIGSHARGYTHKITNALRHLGALYAAPQASAADFPSIDPVQAHVAHCHGCETCDGWHDMLGSQRQASTVDGLPIWWGRFMSELTLRSEGEVRNDLPGILEICALEAIGSVACQASEAVRDVEDAERWRWATAIDESAQTLHSIVLCHGGDQQKINERADFYRAALSAQPVLSSGAPNGRKRTAAERRAPMIERVYGTGVAAQPGAQSSGNSGELGAQKQEGTMPDIRVSFGGTPAILTVSGDYKPGDPPPTGYSAREEWFWVQRRAGLRQKECQRCGRWAFPQELAEGGRVCMPCAAAAPAGGVANG